MQNSLIKLKKILLASDKDVLFPENEMTHYIFFNVLWFVSIALMCGAIIFSFLALYIIIYWFPERLIINLTLLRDIIGFFLVGAGIKLFSFVTFTKGFKKN